MKHIRLYLTAAVLAVGDRITKCLWGNADFDLIPGVLAFHGTRNSGAAFGLLAGVPWLPAVLGLLLCAAVPLLLRKKQLNHRSQFAAGLLLGGVIGNLADRLLTGSVIDFIDPVFLHWFVCNVADIGITCGAVLLAAFLLLGKEGGHP